MGGGNGGVEGAIMSPKPRVRTSSVGADCFNRRVFLKTCVYPRSLRRVYSAGVAKRAGGARTLVSYPRQPPRGGAGRASPQDSKTAPI